MVSLFGRGEYSQALRAKLRSQAEPGIEPAPPWQGLRGKSPCGTIKHNGLLHKVRPVTALKLRLVSTPLRLRFAPFGFAQPPLCLAPLRPCACGLLLTACSSKPHASTSMASVVTAGAVTTECFSQARAAQCVVWLSPPTRCGLGALRLGPSAGCGPSAPRGSLHPGA